MNRTDTKTIRNEKLENSVASSGTTISASDLIPLASTESAKQAGSDTKTVLIQPEGKIPDLDLSQHTTGSWPSSKNVTQ